jgi:heptosyltransferase-2
MQAQFRQILLIQTAFIGDVILATVLIEKLKQYYPEAQIDFLLRKGNESLLQNHPKLREVIIWDKKQGKFKNLWNLTRQIRQKRYDLVVNVQRYASSGLLTMFSGGRIRVGFSANPMAWGFDRRIKHAFDGSHEADRNLALISEWTDSKRIRPALYPSEVDFEQIRPYQTQPYICVAPTSVWFTKQWASEKWIDFLNQVPTTYKIYLIGAPTDLEACEHIAETSQHKNVKILAGKLSLLASAALMQGAVMTYVNDSAPLHLASSMNAPTCAVFCSTVPDFGYFPLSEQSTVIETKETLACRPCGIHGHRVCPEGHFDCAYTIDTKRLIDLLPAI